MELRLVIIECAGYIFAVVFATTIVILNYQVPYIGGIHKAGTTITITCTATGVPDPAYVSW